MKTTKNSNKKKYNYKNLLIIKIYSQKWRKKKKKQKRKYRSKKLKKFKKSNSR